MKKYFTFSILALGILFSVVSCDRPDCKNNNPIFDKYLPNENEYNAELAKQLSKTNKSGLTYWMDTYKEENNTKQMEVYIQGDGLCAKMVLVIDGSEKGIEGIIEKKGIGYRGAELEGLKFGIRQDNTSTKFIFKEIGGIID